MFLYIYYNQTHCSRNVLQTLLSGSKLVKKIYNKKYSNIYKKSKQWRSINYNVLNMTLIKYKKYTSKYLEKILNMYYKNIQVIFYYPHNKWNVPFTNLLSRTSFKKIIYIDDFHSKDLNKANFNLCNRFNKILCSYAYKAETVCPILDKSKIVSFPHYIPDHMLIEMKNKKKLRKIILSGICGKNTICCREWRSKAYKVRYTLLDKFKDNELFENLCIHNNYKGINYYKYINNFQVAISTPGNIGYIVAKYFEIPGSNTLLFGFNKNIEKELENLGFIDGINYIGFNLENIDEKIQEFNTGKINIKKITKNGLDLIKERHTISKRIEKLHNICDNLSKKILK